MNCILLRIWVLSLIRSILRWLNSVVRLWLYVAVLGLGIRDPETGVATYPKVAGIDYSIRNHTGELMYIVTRPDADNFEKNIIEFAAYFTCVMPKRLNLGHWNYTKGSQETPIELEQPLSAIVHWGPKVTDVASDLVRNGGIGFDFMHENEWDPKDRTVVKV